MAIELIDKIKPKNSGDFPMADAEDIDVNGVRLDAVLQNSVEMKVVFEDDTEETYRIVLAPEGGSE